MKKIILAVVLGVTMMITGCDSTSSNKSLNTLKVEEMSRNQIGWHETIVHETWIGSEKQNEGVYLLMTPRGLEKVYSQDALKKSVGIYMDYKVYGKTLDNEFSKDAKKRFRMN